MNIDYVKIRDQHVNVNTGLIYNQVLCSIHSINIKQ